MKKSRKLFPAITLLLISALLLSTASYAWFTMNTTVSATGIDLTVQTANSLLINSTIGAEVTGTGWTNTFNVTNPTITDGLKPASSLDGTSLIYVSGNNSTGKLSATDTDATATTATKNVNYVDYDFSLLYSGEPDEGKTTKEISILIGEGNTAITSEDTDLFKAVRFAVLVDTLDEDDAISAYAVPTGDTVADTNIYGLDTNPSCLTSADDLTATEEVTFLEDGDVVLLATPGTPMTVTVRVWLEGESDFCIDSYAGQSFGINIALTCE